MSVIRTVLLYAGVVLSGVCAYGTAEAASDATLLRVYLTDGSSVVSFGEFARVGDHIVLTMPLGGATDQPRLYVISLPASRIDWVRTDQYAASARYQRYASTRAEDDFVRLNADVARVLSQIAVATDRRRALEIAEGARRLLADWPKQHYNYRQTDVREIVSLLDESISNLRASLGVTQFDLALVAPTVAVPLEPVADLPSIGEQVDQIFRLIPLIERVSERVALLGTALAVIDEAGGAIPSPAAAALRRSAERQIRDERRVDERYASVSRRLMASATSAAERAEVDDVQRVLDSIPREDARLGSRRPEAVDALRLSVQAELEAARQFRLQRDRWAVRREMYRSYQRSAGSLLVQLVKLRPSLEAIRRLEGPEPRALLSMRTRLVGGSERLQRIGLALSADVRPANELLVSAWRFAENAVNVRYEAAASGKVATAWEASSAAAGALMLLSRAQNELRALVEVPTLR